MPTKTKETCFQLRGIWRPFQRYVIALEIAIAANVPPTIPPEIGNSFGYWAKALK
jgi:hypothetical protein